LSVFFSSLLRLLFLLIIIIVVTVNDNGDDDDGGDKKKIILFFFFPLFATLSNYCFICFVFKEKMSSTTASSSSPNITGTLTLRIVDAQTSAENGRKCTKYKVSVNYNGQEWDIWRRYKEFYTLNDKVSKICLFVFLINQIYFV
jgi:hypothetical protein